MGGERGSQAELPSSKRAPRAYSIRPSVVVAFALLAAFLVGTELLLMRENRALAAQVSLLRKTFELEAGMPLRPLSGYGLHGRRKVLFYEGGRDTLLLVFSPECSPCDANWPNWRTALRAAGGNVRAVFVDPTTIRPSRAFVRGRGLSADSVFARVDAQSVLEYRLRFTPQTILVSPEGRVLWIWTGVLSRVALRRLERRTAGGGLPAAVNSAKQGRASSDSGTGPCGVPALGIPESTENRPQKEDTIVRSLIRRNKAFLLTSGLLAAMALTGALAATQAWAGVATPQAQAQVTEPQQSCSGTYCNRTGCLRPCFCDSLEHVCVSL